MSEITAGIKAGRYHQGTLRWGARAWGEIWWGESLMRVRGAEGESSCHLRPALDSSPRRARLLSPATLPPPHHFPASPCPSSLTSPRRRVSRFNSFEGWVGSESVGQDILVSGRQGMNRAMEGDVVAGGLC